MLVNSNHHYIHSDTNNHHSHHNHQHTADHDHPPSPAPSMVIPSNNVVYSHGINYSNENHRNSIIHTIGNDNNINSENMNDTNDADIDTDTDTDLHLTSPNNAAGGMMKLSVSNENLHESNKYNNHVLNNLTKIPTSAIATFTATAQRPTHYDSNNDASNTNTNENYNTITLPLHSTPSSSTADTNTDHSNIQLPTIPSSSYTSNIYDENNSTVEIDYHDHTLEECFQLVELIGSGAFCDVYKAIKCDTGSTYAIKIFRHVYYNDVVRRRQSVKNSDGSENQHTNEIRNSNEDTTMSSLVQHEMSILKQCRHENIVSYYGCLPSAQNNELCLVMDLCEGGSVKNLLERAKEPLLERHIAYIVRCVLLALEYLHSKQQQVVHRDIKAANILLNAEGRVRLADFGISAYTKVTNDSSKTHTDLRTKKQMKKRFQRESEMLEGKNRDDEISKSKENNSGSVSGGENSGIEIGVKRMIRSDSDDSAGSVENENHNQNDTTVEEREKESENTNTNTRGNNSNKYDGNGFIGGSPLWMAPESLQGAPATPSTDIWSLGITVLELAHGVPPHSEVKSFTDVIARICFSPPPNFVTSRKNAVLHQTKRTMKVTNTMVSPAMSDFLKLCLQKDPTQRATVQQLLQHHFVTGTLNSVCSNGSLPITSFGASTFLGPAAEASTKPDSDFAHFLVHHQYYRWMSSNNSMNNNYAFSIPTVSRSPQAANGRSQHALNLLRRNNSCTVGCSGSMATAANSNSPTPLLPPSPITSRRSVKHRLPPHHTSSSSSSSSHSILSPSHASNRSYQNQNGNNSGDKHQSIIPNRRATIHVVPILDDTGKHLRKKPHLMDRRFSQPQSSPPVRRMLSPGRLAYVNAMNNAEKNNTINNERAKSRLNGNNAHRRNSSIRLNIDVVDEDEENTMIGQHDIQNNNNSGGNKLLSTPKSSNSEQQPQPPFNLKRALSIHIPDDEAIMNKSFLISADGAWCSGGFTVGVDGISSPLSSSPITGHTPLTNDKIATAAAVATADASQRCVGGLGGFYTSSTTTDFDSDYTNTPSSNTSTSSNDTSPSNTTQSKSSLNNYSYSFHQQSTHSPSLQHDSSPSLTHANLSPSNNNISSSTSSSMTGTTTSLTRMTSGGFKISASDLVICGQIGRGQNGPVFKALHLPTLTRVALKHMNVHERGTRHQLLKELSAFSKFNSQCIYLSSFLGAFYDDGNITIAGYYMDAGSLQSFVKRHAKPLEKRLPKPILPFNTHHDGDVEMSTANVNINNTMKPTLTHSVSLTYDTTPAPTHRPRGLCEPLLAAITKQIVLGLEYLHSNHQLHRDIKPDNILIDHDLRIRINDFGLCTELSNTLAVTETFLGTLSYMAPERVASREYGYPSDIWSLGMLIVYCATATLPSTHSGSDYWSMLNQAMQLNISNQQERENNAMNDNSVKDSENDDMLEKQPARRAHSVDHTYGNNSTNTHSNNTMSNSPISSSSLSSLSPVYYSDELRDFVAQCLHVDPHQRLTAKELLNHPFIADVHVDIDSMRSLTNKQFWADELEMNVKDLHTMLAHISATNRNNNRHTQHHHHTHGQQTSAQSQPHERILHDHEIAMLSAQFGLDIYTVRQIAQASDLKVQ